VHVPNRGTEGLWTDEDTCGDVAEDQGQPEPSGHDPPQEGGHQDERDVAGYSHDPSHTLLRSPGSSTGQRPRLDVPLLLIHRSAWKWNSANFALTEFSEVRV
jgi:hypothetical protein